jgi:sodium/hydrogen exchanger 8
MSESPGSNDVAASSKAVVPVVIAICITYSLSSLAITRFKEFYGYAPWIHESSLAALVGLILGGVIKHTTGQTIEFSKSVFFYMVLPPIIFSAGISLKRKKFFKYIHLISLFGVVGTICNFVIITAVTYYSQHVFEFRDKEGDLSPVPHAVQLSWSHCMILAAVLSGTDEVSALSLMPMREYPRLGALIFGEGVLNDAISIVLFHVLVSSRHQLGDVDLDDDVVALAWTLALSVANEVLCSLLIGIACGLINARMFRTLDIIREHPIHQSVFVLLFAYLAYSVAEAADVSGILTLFVCAVTQSHYAWSNMSKPAQVGIKISSVALSDIAEGFAFSYVGLSMWEYTDDGGFHFAFSGMILAIVVGARLVTIAFLAFLCTRMFRGFHMPISEQLAFTMGGVVRGCLCWAQILQVRRGEEE